MITYTAVLNPAPLTFPLVTARVAAGFPSPADDHLEAELDLHSLLISNAPATFFVRAIGDSMSGPGKAPIGNGDLLVVDKSLEARNGDVVIAVIDGEFTVKRLKVRNGRTLLEPENPRYPTIEITGERDCVIWGVVTSRISKLR